jgi:hypothetical protein
MDSDDVCRVLESEDIKQEDVSSFSDASMDIAETTCTLQGSSHEGRFFNVTEQDLSHLDQGISALKHQTILQTKWAMKILSGE